jgi:hypothetical protein
MYVHTYAGFSAKQSGLEGISLEPLVLTAQADTGKANGMETKMKPENILLVSHHVGKRQRPEKFDRKPLRAVKYRA